MSERDARDRILARIDRALEGRSPVEHPGPVPDLRPDGEGGEESPPSDVVAAFGDAVRRAGGEVVGLHDEAAARAWLEDFAADFASTAVGRGVPSALTPPLPGVDGAGAELGVSVAAGAAADTGTLLFDSSTGMRARLLPPVHLVWVDAATVRATLADAMEDALGRGLPAALTLHSGPSKSADIGRIVVTGVHGPGRLIAAVIDAGGFETERSGDA